MGINAKYSLGAVVLAFSLAACGGGGASPAKVKSAVQASCMAGIDDAEDNAMFSKKQMKDMCKCTAEKTAERAKGDKKLSKNIISAMKVYKKNPDAKEGDLTADQAAAMEVVAANMKSCMF